jgi:hypothetical protein
VYLSKKELLGKFFDPFTTRMKNRIVRLFFQVRYSGSKMNPHFHALNYLSASNVSFKVYLAQSAV